MNQVVCNFAPLRFLPYREVGEFVNVGVVLHCPQSGFFGYRLAGPEPRARVREFFPQLAIELLQTALDGVTRELDRFSNICRGDSTESGAPLETPSERLARFKELIRQREGLLHFGESGSLLAETPELALEQLFARFVEGQTAREKRAVETATP